MKCLMELAVIKVILICVSALCFLFLDKKALGIVIYTLGVVAGCVWYYQLVQLMIQVK